MDCRNQLFNGEFVLSPWQWPLGGDRILVLDGGLRRIGRNRTV